MGLLDGDTALVTGAVSGIGRGIARALAAEGARLVLSDISTEAGQALARELGATFVFADLSDPAAARSLFVEAEARWSAFAHRHSVGGSRRSQMMS
jgi:NAD(P)-dependent dehydrogenase (short-subunit alcohol dehydrogenase family)